MAVQLQTLTAEDLAQLSSDARFELVEGELVTMAPPNDEHGDLALAIGSMLRAYVKANGLGKTYVETGYILRRNPDTVRSPDVSFLRRDRVRTKGLPPCYVEGPPDLAVEVISPHDRVSEIENKVDDYLQYGTRLVWVVYPKSRRVMVYRADGTSRILQANETLEGEDVIPGFAVALAEIWEDL